MKKSHQDLGIYHKRLNPDNCLVYQNKHLKIQNFKNALFFGKQAIKNVFPIGSKEAKALPNMKEGLNYMSPEFIEESIDTPAIDFWAFGCIIYFMLTGQDPFSAPTEQQVVIKIISRNINIKDLKDVSDDAKDLLNKLL